MDGGFVRRAAVLAVPALVAALTYATLSLAPGREPPPPPAGSTVAREEPRVAGVADPDPSVAQAARAYFGTRAQDFGGVHLDPNGRAVVLVTRDAAGHERALRRLTGAGPDRLAVLTVRYAFADLEHAVLTAAGRVEGAPAAWVDEPGNRAVVGLTDDTPAVRAAVLRAVPARYHGMLRFERTAPATFSFDG